MTDSNSDRIKALFDEAVEMSSDQRESFLAEQCGDDDDLRRRIESLLSEDDGMPDDYLQAPLASTRMAGATVESGRVIADKYRLLQVLGEGGMGIVYLAEQDNPRRRVALKIIKPGMDSRMVVARFEAERQALAVMDHPGIARVIDGGTTDRDLPYFVMEFVKGEPITVFCAKNRLTIDQRVKLMIEVCAAVQHAHAKGVIHRDLKPTNVLVGYDAEGHARPKVIDFGVAKALHQRLSEHTVFTAYGQFIGTPEYMSPEQAEMSGTDIDTRADVYSLGVLLYELLTGFRPFELKAEAFNEIQRIIREVEPPRPSTRLSTILSLVDDPKTASRITSERRADARALTGVLRRDLDWVVMRSLEKNRERRYDTANGLALDLARYLGGEPVLAGPPSATYRLRKFIGRNRRSVAAVSVSILLLVLGIIGTTYGLVQARRQGRLAEIARAEEAKRAAELQQVADFQSEQLGGVDPNTMGLALRDGLREKLVRLAIRRGLDDEAAAAALEAYEALVMGADFTGLALETLEREIFAPSLAAIDRQFADQPLVRARLLQTMAETFAEVGMLELATAPQAEALAIRRRVLGDEQPDTLTSIDSMGSLLQSQGKIDEAGPYRQEALDGRRRILGDAHPDTLTSINNMGALLQSRGELDEAEPYYREALEGRRRVLGDEHPDTLSSINNVAVLRQRQGRLDEAERFYRETLEIRRRVLGDEHSDTLISINNLGALLHRQGKLDEAEPYYREALEVRRRVLGDAHPDTLSSINNMAYQLQGQGKLDLAEPYYNEAIEGYRRVLGDDHLNTLGSIHSTGGLLRDLGRMEEAEVLGAEAVELARKLLPEGHRRLGACLGGHGKTLLELGRFEEAEGVLVEAQGIFEAALGSDHERTISSLADLYAAWHEAEAGKGYDTKAAEWRAKLPQVDVDDEP